MAAFWDEADLSEAARFVVQNACRSVALQFPADLLHTGHVVVQDLRSRLREADSSAKVYLLAETGNKGKAVDVIGAAHANADAVIQFGDASLVPVAGVLVHHVLPKKGFKTDSLIAQIKQLLSCLSKDVLVVLLDGPFMHVRASLLDALKGLPVHVTESPYELTRAEHDSLLHNLASCTSKDRSNAKATCHFLWVGETADNKTLEYAMISHGDEKWTLFNPSTCTAEEDIPPYLQRQIMRRRYLIHLAQEAEIVGILVGTVGIRDWQTQLNSVKELARASGKKSYTFFLGKTPTPEKLANFPEVNVWVHVADPSSFAWHSKEFMAPVIAPAEAELAWRPLLPSFDDKAACSLVVETSSYGEDPDSWDSQTSETHVATHQHAGALTSQGPRTVQHTITSAKDFLLKKRSYLGVETPATGAPVKPAALATPGMAGRAAAYTKEEQ